MRVAEVDPDWMRLGGAVVGGALGAVATRVVDGLPRRYGVTQLVTGAARSRRNVGVVVSLVMCVTGIAHVLTGAGDDSLAHAGFLLVVNAVVASCVVAAAAIDLEHMILPNELTLGAAVLCIASSPLRAIGLLSSITGALVGLAVAYVPFVLYKRLRGQSGMGLGDAKLTLMAGAWHGIAGGLFVVFLGALQQALAALMMRTFGITYEVPESVKAEIRELRARAAAGDDDAKRELADDPMAAEGHEGTLGMRLPLGPFLALACIEVLFLRRWLVEHVLGLLAQ